MDSSTQPEKTALFTKWVDDHSDALYAWAFHKTSSKETAEDLVQETFLAAFRAFDRYENQSSPKTWLFSILNNKIIDFYRKNSKSFKSAGSLSEDQADAISESFFDPDGNWNNQRPHPLWESETQLLDDVEFQEIWQFCIGDLPEKWNLVITSKFFLEKSAEEICQELEITPTNYWQLIRRAKLLLKKCIEQYWNK